MAVYEVAFFTSSRGKFNYVARLLERNERIRLSLLLDEAPQLESDYASINAATKALWGSRLTALDVVACDEELYFPPDALVAQPGAKIRRITSQTATDAEMIEYYRCVLEALPPVKRKASILASYALARRGIILRNTTIRQELKLVVPPSATWLERRPLSAFHYVPRFGRIYAELNEDERAEVDAPIGAALGAFLLGKRQYGRSGK